MVEVAEIEGQPDPLYPSMALLVQLARMVAPHSVHDALAAKARYLQSSIASNHGYKAEARFMRVLQDGIDFGKWL
jgi:hypothetical protein